MNDMQALLEELRRENRTLKSEKAKLKEENRMLTDEISKVKQENMRLNAELSEYRFSKYRGMNTGY